MSNDSNEIIDFPGITQDYRSGRVAWDDRGNSVWEWQTAPGVYSRDADTQRVRVLQIADLELLDAPERGNERAFSVSPAKEYPSRAGMNLPDRGKTQPQQQLQSNGLIKRLRGR